jgi:hypothetical protein
MGFEKEAISKTVSGSTWRASDLAKPKPRSMTWSVDDGDGTPGTFVLARLEPPWASSFGNKVDAVGGDGGFLLCGEGERSPM